MTMSGGGTIVQILGFFGGRGELMTENEKKIIKNYKVRTIIYIEKRDDQRTVPTDDSFLSSEPTFLGFS